MTDATIDVNIEVPMTEEQVRRFHNVGPMLPPTPVKGEDPKDTQLTAMAYLLTEICKPTLQHYQHPRKLEKNGMQTLKAREALRLLKEAGF